MAHSDSEEEIIDDIEFDGTEADEDIEDDILDALEGDLAAAAEEATEGDDDSDSDDSDGGSDDEEHYGQPPLPQSSEPPEVAPPLHHSKPPSPQGESPPVKPPSPIPRRRSLSPAQIRINNLLADLRVPKSYTVEAICAIPHPFPTHSLASSLCMTHLLTGSEDGYIRDYDIFSAVNGKVFLTAPQRHHCGVMEGLMKAAQIKCWWENPAASPGGPDDPPLSAPYSLLMQSNALWSLAGSKQGHINLFTVRHDPGRLCHVMSGHRAPVSAMALQHDEKGFFSAGWDSEAYQWDLNTGQIVRNFKSHGSQLTAIAVRPLQADFSGNVWAGFPASIPADINAKPPRDDGMFVEPQQAPPDPAPTMQPSDGLADQVQPQINAAPPANPAQIQPPVPSAQDEDDSKSDTSFDPLFDDEPDADGEPDNGDSNQATPAPPVNGNRLGVPSLGPPPIQQPQQQPRSVSGAIAPKNAPPILDPVSYASYSPDVLMVASIDGQIVLWDKRVHSPGSGVGRLWMSEKTPPWCVSACWSADGSQIYAGRRNGAVEIYDVRQFGQAAMGTPRLLKTLRNPLSSGVVSCVVAFPDGRHLACASSDNIRLWNVAEAGEPDAFGKVKSGVQFKIIPGHHGGLISQMLVDPAARFLVSASSNRGWFGESTRTVFVHEIKHIH